MSKMFKEGDLVVLNKKANLDPVLTTAFEEQIPLKVDRVLKDCTTFYVLDVPYNEEIPFGGTLYPVSAFDVAKAKDSPSVRELKQLLMSYYDSWLVYEENPEYTLYYLDKVLMIRLALSELTTEEF